MRLAVTTLLPLVLAAASAGAQGVPRLASDAPRSAAASRPAALRAPVRPRAVVASPNAAAVAQMRSKLRLLVLAQEEYWLRHGSYTTDVAALGLLDRSGPTPQDSTVVRVFSAGGRGWSGMSTHRALGGRSCVIYVGRPEELPKLPTTLAERREATHEALTACDDAP